MGPTISISKEIFDTKYAINGESFEEAMHRIASHLEDDTQHGKAFEEILQEQRFLPGGRIQATAGSGRNATSLNCFVSSIIQDDMSSIMDVAKEAAQTMRMGGGIGYDFSTLRPKGDLIKSLGSRASGPVSFMQIFDAICKTVASAGHRRGAQMGVLRVDHPSIEEFIEAKQNENMLTAFNISIAITDEFMTAVKGDLDFDLRFNGVVYRTIKARALWDKIMRTTWDWAEPGVIFIDRINQLNNLWYAETIYTCNPCSEQSLPPNSACLLGSFNLVKYIKDGRINYKQLIRDIQVVHPAMDNVVDRSIYPLEIQRQAHLQHRRMGIGVTGLANALEKLGMPYGTKLFLEETDLIMRTICENLYLASSWRARTHGSFPLYREDAYLAGDWIQRLSKTTRAQIAQYGIRNSHLTSIAPTGTISLCADNVSSGIEPVFSHSYERTIQTFDGPKTEIVEDYAYREWDIKGRTANEISVDDHLNVLLRSQKWIDSAISKTCNVGADVSFEDFKNIYMKAYDGGAKGCTTFRASGKRYGILNEVEKADDDPQACYFDAVTGQKSCS